MNNYDVSVPVFLKGFKNLTKWLDKAQEFAASNPDVPNLVEASLAPDMFNLAGQIQVASDMAKSCAARLSGAGAPRFEDDEVTFSDLRLRITKTVEFLNSLTAEQFEANANAEITVVLKQGVLRFSTLEFLTQFALPNFYFHLTTAYDILRHKGVPLGKMDYLGVLDTQD
ncbi:DUF1993 family protein [Pseudomonas sp. NPDC087358]|uniref:DUF1993 domain-containing protein n=1 Tax=Pseudomonas sp. NPDC087358 TaxID=3364439 RepID=UPI00384F012A